MSKQRGRKPGSVSFMQVELSELNRILKPDAKVILSIRYAQLIGLQGKAVSSNLDVITHCVSSGKAEMKLVDFGNDEPDSPKPNKVKDEIKDDDHISPQAELETFDESPF
jgi:elongation factor P hydroxylase